MKIRLKRYFIPRAVFILCCVILIFLPTIASSEETYRFERMWPTLQQPWYFHTPHDIAVDPSDNVYIADTYMSRIQKFSSDGRFITKWGSYGSEDGQFSSPAGIAVDVNGNIYVVDALNSRIQKFNPENYFYNLWKNNAANTYLAADIVVNGSDSVVTINGADEITLTVSLVTGALDQSVLYFDCSAHTRC